MGRKRKGWRCARTFGKEKGKRCSRRLERRRREREREGGEGVQSAIILYDLELESTTHTKGKGYIEREVRGGHKGRGVRNRKILL